MKIIITGATGFVGRNLAEQLHDDDISVIANGRNLKTGNELEKKGIEFVKADILNLNDLKKAFTPADCLIHCAAKTGDWGDYADFYATNVIGTENVIQGCKTRTIQKIIFISTPSIYYSGKDRYDVCEDDVLPAKQFNYGKTKLSAEKKLLALKNENFRVIILRPRAVYGRYDQTFVPRILALSKKKRVPLINGGRALVDITYIDNLVNAIRCCFAAPDNAWNEAYNISNGNPIRVREWFSQILEVFNRPFNPTNVSLPIAQLMAVILEVFSRLPFGNKKPSLTRFSVGYMGKSLTMSIEKAKQKLHYRPIISNYDGFKMYKEWYNGQ
ncbi:MAG: NAD(P)-dependent oxidoreductase [Chitinivibrionales bacterium]|nr:NAD(P)-dependent oxidoreductase [Chitinivibrionales bacterium]